MAIFDVLMPVEGMPGIGTAIERRCPCTGSGWSPIARAWLADSRRASARSPSAPAISADRRRADAPASQLEDRREFRRRLRPYRRRLGAASTAIIVTHTPGVLDDEVADTAMALTLATVRQLPQAERYLREGHWPKAPIR